MKEDAVREQRFRCAVPLALVCALGASGRPTETTERTVLLMLGIRTPLRHSLAGGRALVPLVGPPPAGVHPAQVSVPLQRSHAHQDRQKRRPRLPCYREVYLDGAKTLATVPCWTPCVDSTSLTSCLLGRGKGDTYSVMVPR